MNISRQLIIKRILSILLVLTSGSWIIFTTNQSTKRDPTNMVAPQVGFMIPDFNLTGIYGEKYQISTYKSTPMVVNFWASWCKPCEAEMPALQNMYKKYSSEIAILTINNTQQDNLEEVRKFINFHQLEFPVLLDHDGTTISLFNIQALPTTYFVNSKGIITEIIIGGPMSEVLLEIRINNLLETQ